MDAISGVSSHLLLNRKENGASHSTRKAAHGPSSAFASYAYGPMDLPDGDNGVAVDGTKSSGASGTNSISAAATGGSVAWLANQSIYQHQK